MTVSTPVRLLGFLAAAAAVFGLALLVGGAVGPVADEEPASHDTHVADATADGHGGHGDAHPAAADLPGGLMVSQGGYTLALAQPTGVAGTDVPVRFSVLGPDGSPVTDFDVVHEKRLHLIAVRRDLTGFQHVHPTLDDEGTWSTELDLSPGTWRVFADFAPSGGEPVTLGADLSIPGDFRPAPAAPGSRTATVGDYTVTLDGDLAPGEEGALRLEVSRDGTPVTDLQPYLGAYGHLVALREGDLAYLHVHPDGTPGDGSTDPGPEVVFHTTVPSAGRYHLYLDFRHDGVVRTAHFTVTAGAPAPTDDSGHDDTDDHSHSHEE